MKFSILFTAFLILSCSALPPVPLIGHPAGGEETKKEKDKLTSATLSGLKFRGIGPALTSGRVVDFAVDPKDRSYYFVAVACGGVWRTTNAGTTFDPVFDGQKSFSIGCVTMDPTNNHVVWVGTGENNSQRSVSYGDGVYKSVDGGKSWKCMGLTKSEHIGRIVVDPKNPNTVFVAALGPLWGPGGERGLYKTTDGGKSWNGALLISENTGINDVVMDPRDPSILYASSYQRRRHVWTLIDGGPEGNIFKSTDGGATWDTLRNGLPGGDKGRIGLAISPVNPDVLYAIIELPDNKGGVWRSTDRGGSWEKRSDYVSSNPQYYQELVCDPKDVDRVYSLDTFLMVSDDGFKTFRPLGNRHRHVDDHAMWIDPEHPDYYLVGGDGGVYESFDRGATWRFKENLPVTQFYRVSVDNSLPFYSVYGGTQDNNSLGGPSRTLKSDGIMSEDWFVTWGGDGFKSQIDPEDPDIVYAQAQHGDLCRFDRKSGERVPIQPQPGKGEEPYRWNWDSPLIVSSHNHTRLYFAANFLFRSDDRGDSWTKISGDLTRRIDRNSLPVMGKVWGPEAVAKNVSTSFYGNIVALNESPVKEGLLYAGTDDGLIQTTPDGGKTWRKLDSFPGVPAGTYVSCILPSSHDAATVYASFDNHKMADFKPYLLKSTDGGGSWKNIAGNLPENGAVYAIAEDFTDPDLLFAGTEFGLFVTVDGGKNWVQMQSGLPPAAIRDIAIQKREQDLVLATFGRGFYVLDDYSPLRALKKETLEKEAHLFPIKDALMYIPQSHRSKGAQGETFFTAPNPPFGAVFTCYIRDVPKSKREMRREAEKEAEKKKQVPPYPTIDQLRAESEEAPPELLFVIADGQGNVVRKLRAPMAKGIQRMAWDLRYADLGPVREQASPNDRSAMLALPGEYTVSIRRIVNGAESLLVEPAKFRAVLLNNVSLPAPDRNALLDFERAIAAAQRAVMGTLQAMREIRARLGAIKSAIDIAAGATPDMRLLWSAADEKLKEAERAMTGDPERPKRNENSPPSIVGRLNDILYGLWSSTAAPTKTFRDGYAVVVQEFTPVYNRIKNLLDGDMRVLESRLESIKAPWTPGRLPEWEGK